MRQYAIFYRRVGMPSFIQLDPSENRNLYEREEVRHAVDHMRRNRIVDGMCVKTTDELYNVMAFEQEAVAPKAFTFEDEISINEPIDAMALMLACGLNADGTGPLGVDGPVGTDGEQGEPEVTATSKDGKTTLRLVR